MVKSKTGLGSFAISILAVSVGSLTESSQSLPDNMMPAFCAGVLPLSEI